MLRYFVSRTQFILIKMFNLNSYGELGLDDVNVYDFEFPHEYENAVRVIAHTTKTKSQTTTHTKHED